MENTHHSIPSLGAAEIARLIRSGQLTPLEAVEACITQIKKVNPQINALVTPTFEQAREQAHRAGEVLARKPSSLPPLFGVPVTIKDAFAVAGVRFTGGSIHYRDQIASEDAPAVSRLKAAGAILLGKTNCADMSGSTETNNLLFGLTRNPWNLAHSAGGSTGGEGALIAAGGSPLGLGSDIGGSIRLPAAFCGIVGLKPSAGRVPTQGHLPPTPPAIYGWNTVGPLARRVEDLALALSVLSDTPCADFRAIPLENRCLLLADPLFFSPPSAEAARAIQAAADSLARRNMQVIEKANLPMLAAAFTYAAIMHREWLPPFRLELGKGRLARLLPECLANLRGKGRVSPSTLALLWLVSVAGPFSRLLGYGSFEKLARLRQRILAQMGPGGLILWPIWPTPAPRHGFAWQPQYMPAYTGAVNCLGFPSVVVPLGLSAQKLPLSVQIIARPNEDEVALAAAAALENEFPMPSLP